MAIAGKTELSTPQWIAVEIFIMALIGLVFGFLGPFGTYALPLGLRLAYWVVFIIIGYAIFRPIVICAEWLSDLTGLSRWTSALLSSLIAALPLTFLIGFAVSGMRFNSAILSEQFLPLYLQCAAIGLGINALMVLVFGRRRLEAGSESVATLESASDNPRTSDKTPLQPRTRLHERLPGSFPNEILALSVEDHYVRVYGSGKSEILLMRLRDAINEMEPAEGIQVHRSWWIARDAIMTSKRDGRNLRVILNGGQEIPVSRSFVGKLKQTGWI